jgi:hypothetical protein
MVTRVLQWYQRHLPSESVRINLRVTIPDVGAFGQDSILSDAELTAHALDEGRTTWDESDICALAQCELPSADLTE